MTMTTPEKAVCAGALFANGAGIDRIAVALGTDTGTAQSLAEAAAELQAAGQMGNMRKSGYLRADHAG